MKLEHLLELIRKKYEVLNNIKSYSTLCTSLFRKTNRVHSYPLVYPHRDWLRNYIWNWMQVNGIKCNRSTIWAEDEFKYYTKNGYITKRKTNKYLGYVSNTLLYAR